MPIHFCFSLLLYVYFTTCNIWQSVYFISLYHIYRFLVKQSLCYPVIKQNSRSEEGENCTTYSGYGLAILNRLQSNLSGCHSTVSRVNLPNIFIDAAFARLFSVSCITFTHLVAPITITTTTTTTTTVLWPFNPDNPDEPVPEIIKHINPRYHH